MPDPNKPRSPRNTRQPLPGQRPVAPRKPAPPPPPQAAPPDLPMSEQDLTMPRRGGQRSSAAAIPLSSSIMPGETDQTVPRRGSNQAMTRSRTADSQIRPVRTGRPPAPDLPSSGVPMTLHSIPVMDQVRPPRRGPGPSPQTEPATGSPISRGPASRPRPAVNTAGSSGLEAVVNFDRKYVVSDELGRGGLGVVLAAEDLSLRRELAIKVLRAAEDEELISDFIDEAQITGQLEHPNIVPVYDLGLDGQQQPYMAMKMVRGTTLWEMVQGIRAGRLRFSPVGDQIAAGWLDIFQKACDAVGYAHSRGVVHRDLKPANVMVGDFGEVLVIDWGLARLLKDHEQRAAAPDRRPSRRVQSGPRESDDQVTIDGLVFGTPAYMPPEQANGKMSEVDERADIFSLGAILYQMLTLEAPYTGSTVDVTLRKAAMHELPSPRRRAPRRQIPKELDAIVMKAMAAEPRQRYRTVGELQADLRAWQSNQPVSAWRASLIGRAAKWVRRHPTTAMTGGVGTVMTAIAAIVISMLAAQASEAKAEKAQLEVAQSHLESEAAREREDKLRAMAREGNMALLLSELGGKLKHEWEDARNDFYSRRGAAQAAGSSDQEFVHTLASTDVGKYTSAFERMLAAHVEKPESIPVRPEDYHFLGLLYQVGDSDTSRAMDLYTRAINFNPEYAQAYLVRGWLKMQDQQWDSAEEDFRSVIRIGSPFNHELASAYLGRGFARFLLDDRAEAIDDLRKGTELNPNELPPDFISYIEPLENNQVFTTIARCQAAVTEDETKWSAWVVLGVVYSEAKQKGLAKEAFDKAEKHCDSGIQYFLGSFRKVFENKNR